MSRESKKKITRQYLILTLALVAIILSVIALTRAWFSQNKGLQTMTKVEVPYLFLKGHDSDTVSIELGEIDVRNSGEKKIPFIVEANDDSYFKLQLGYTTNLPLSYTIVEVDEFKNDNWKNIEADEANIVEGNYLNIQTGSKVANNTKHVTTYENYSENYVQMNAEPLYWQSESIAYGNKRHSFILIVSWKINNEKVIDKDTDMIYLTAGITGDPNETKTNQE